jgi:lipopolysaccharide-induced tumor necrosis factor-alpha factor
MRLVYLRNRDSSTLSAHQTFHRSITNTYTVPMQQYPQSPDVTGQQQPPVYHQDPNAAQYQQQQQYAQHPQQQYGGSPPPQHPQGAYMQPQATGGHIQPQPGMPPQQPSGTVYQNATPIASLGRGPAPADCPACGQRAMTNVAFEIGNTTQYVHTFYPSPKIDKNNC